MDHKSHTEWKGELVFESELRGFKHTMDGDNKIACSPKPYLLASLAGCAGIDIVDLLRKMRQNVTSLAIDVDGDLSEDFPQVYTDIEVRIKIGGENLDPQKVEKAVNLSKDKYCGVSAMLGKSAVLNYVVEYV